MRCSAAVGPQGRGRLWPQLQPPVRLVFGQMRVLTRRNVTIAYGTWIEYILAHMADNTGRMNPRTLWLRRSVFVRIFGIASFFAFTAVVSADSLNWSKDSQRISADIKSGKLSAVLAQIAAHTGWQVFVEPDTSRQISAKFNNVPTGEGLRLRLAELNSWLDAGTNANAKLCVDRTDMNAATQLGRGANQPDLASKGKPTPNELVVRRQPGAKIEDIARLQRAKVVGKID